VTLGGMSVALLFFPVLSVAFNRMQNISFPLQFDGLKGVTAIQELPVVNI